MDARGERGALVVDQDFLTRLSSNPFFPYLLDRVGDGISQPSGPSGHRIPTSVPAGLPVRLEAVLSTRFADIFRNNSGKMGLVVAAVPEAVIHRLWEAIEEDPNLEIVIDVEHKRVAAPSLDLDVKFELDDFTQYRLLNGLDDVGLTLRHADAIDTYYDYEDQHGFRGAAELCNGVASNTVTSVVCSRRWSDDMGGDVSWPDRQVKVFTRSCAGRR